MVMYSGDEVYDDEVTSGLMDEGFVPPNVLCGECGEVTQDERRFHPSCCSHDNVEAIDDRDDRWGRRYLWCSDCDAEVIEDVDEDGAMFFELAEEV